MTTRYYKNREELRAVARELGVKRGRNDSDTLRNLRAAGIVILPVPPNIDQALLAAARSLVKEMNPYEAARFPDQLDRWPLWAQSDVNAAIRAFQRAREL